MEDFADGFEAFAEAGDAALQSYDEYAAKKARIEAGFDDLFDLIDGKKLSPAQQAQEAAKAAKTRAALKKKLCPKVSWASPITAHTNHCLRT